MNIRINQIFTSIQGESTLQGFPAVFVRLAGCNLQCQWCDTPKSRDSSSGYLMSIEKLITEITSTAIKHVCVTGGEPLVQTNCIDLLKRLIELNYVVQLETNGSVDITGLPKGVRVIMDIKCPSSGMQQFNRLTNIQQLDDKDEIKFVIADRTDYKFSVDIFKKYLTCFTGAVLFSPVWNQLEAHKLANWILSDTIPVRLHLQLHKILGLP